MFPRNSYHPQFFRVEKNEYMLSPNISCFSHSASNSCNRVWWERGHRPVFFKDPQMVSNSELRSACTGFSKWKGGYVILTSKWRWKSDTLEVVNQWSWVASTPDCFCTNTVLLSTSGDHNKFLKSLCHVYMCFSHIHIDTNTKKQPYVYTRAHAHRNPRVICVQDKKMCFSMVWIICCELCLEQSTTGSCWFLFYKLTCVWRETLVLVFVHVFFRNWAHLAGNMIRFM